jgi:hypothetical protein
VASGGERAGEAGRDGKRLEIAAAVRALFDDGCTIEAIGSEVGWTRQQVETELVRQLKSEECSVKEIRAELGLTNPRYYRILDALGIAHSHAARRSRAELANLNQEGPDRPYSIQLTAGVPCRFSVHFEGSGFRVEALPVREEAQAVEL